MNSKRNTNGEQPPQELPYNVQLTVSELEGHHRVGCPQDPFRMESYDVDRPLDAGGGSVRVSRCMECGSHLVAGRRVEEVT